MPDRIHSTVAKVFGIKPEDLSDDASPDTVPSWDSMGHLHLIMAIEEEFHLSLSPEQAEEMLSVRLIRTILRENGVEC